MWSSREGQRATIMSVMRDQRITKSKERRGTAGDHKGLCWRMRALRDGARTQGDRSRRPGKTTHPCIVGAGLAPALPCCTRSFIRQQSLKAHPSPHHPPSPLQNPGLALTAQFALFCLSDGSLITHALLVSTAAINVLYFCASPFVINFGAKPKV